MVGISGAELISGVIHYNRPLTAKNIPFSTVVKLVEETIAEGHRDDASIAILTYQKLEKLIKEK
jgi:hypothetical protein